ncbi:MAG: bifunctional [glutamate--ammonia ligase]-adenylyl-L-tyrosine phosphorylase/[glutamate--ammonia-ligase] adenylyltransferase [Azoarcus sp.]|jgi:glutamate-ammonia-ligase adenylyltransferase|nr:bifunctional [glutamate--ammonia ligase]-adenylyl-L-tyrosine phosphorylase/[glutamate--ammonia-ligase] adenylyltransferase [Azoarcus sp.]
MQTGLPASEIIRRATRQSRFLQRMLDSRPWLEECLASHLDQPIDGQAMRAFIAQQGSDETHLRPALRQLRAWVLCHLIVRDLSGMGDLDEVTETMTELAETAVRHAHAVLRPALLARYGAPRSPSGEEQEFIIVGMGKLGGRELNVSSDIDLIFLYPEDGSTAGLKSIDNFAFFERLGKQIIAALAEMTEHGRVFRVDMRLRPNGDSGPLAGSFDMLENYFVTQGREWERYAWIKARVIVGERADELQSISRPFVFRKYLDFGAISAMRALHAQIRREVARHERAHNIKLGPGGIREIEFIAQAFQLIRGGREQALQVRPTLQALARLAARGILQPEAVEELRAAYVFLRRLEHRLQYLDDAQTHDLPENENDQNLIAEAMGFAGYAAFLEELGRHRAAVSAHFEAIFGEPEPPDDDARQPAAIWQNALDPAGTANALGELGYRVPQAGAARLEALRAGARYGQLPDNIRSRFDALVPRIIAAALTTPEPDDALTRCLNLLDTITRRGAYLALLQEYPLALLRLVDLAGASLWAAQYLERHPILLDDLLGADSQTAAPDWPQFRRVLAAELEALEPDMEQQMDVMRERHHAQVFRLLVQDIAGALTVEKLADHLSMLADIMVGLAIPLCWRRVKPRHREAPQFAVIGYGKLGGKELGYASDLDIIFLYDDDFIDAGDLYARLAQRIRSWLSSRTSAGILFESDLRLRPNGESGLVACSLDTFRQYQLASAWTWEHQALTRARFVAGDAALGEKFERIRESILRLPRDKQVLCGEVIAMRDKMRDAHAGKSPLFDLKHDPGGLVDVEFLVQYLVLGHAHEHAELTGNLGNIALLGIAAKLGLIPASLAAACASSYRELRQRQHRQRLNGQPSRIPQDSAAALREPVRALWQEVFGEIGKGK